MPVTAIGERRSRLNLLKIREVLKLPDPTYLIAGLIEQGALVTLYGPPGEGKSFIALGWALCVATSLPWFGRAVRPGRVIYIATEGGQGIKKRVAAWLRYHGLEDAADASMILESVELRRDVEGLITKIRALEINPVLIVIDTLARSFSGDENSTKEMGEYIRAAQRLQEEASRIGRCTTLLVHHSGKNEKKGARGSSALLGAVDVMISVSKDAAGFITVTNEKQKDDEEFAPITLALTPVSIGTSAEGKPITSCVLENRTLDDLLKLKPAQALNQSQRAALRALEGLGEAQTKDWRERTQVELKKDNLSPDTFEKWRSELVKGGYAEAVPFTNPAHYRLTGKGVSAIGAPTSANHELHTSVSHASKPEGLAGRAERTDG